MIVRDSIAESGNSEVSKSQNKFFQAQQILLFIDPTYYISLHTLGLHNIPLGAHILTISPPIIIIPLIITIMIRNRNIRNFIPHLHPCITRRRNRTNLAQRPITQSRNDETSEKVEVVDALGADGDLFANRAYESHDVDQYAKDVGEVSPPMKASSVVVWTSLLPRVQIFDL